MSDNPVPDQPQPAPEPAGPTDMQKAREFAALAVATEADSESIALMLFQHTALAVSKATRELKAEYDELRLSKVAEMQQHDKTIADLATAQRQLSQEREDHAGTRLKLKTAHEAFGLLERQLAEAQEFVGGWKNAAQENARELGVLRAQLAASQAAEKRLTEAIAANVKSLLRWAHECFPESANGQKHFVRLLMEGIAEDLVAALASSAGNVKCFPLAEPSAGLTAAPEPTYKCVECGLPRTKAQGGTTFTVCDACWEKLHPSSAGHFSGSPGVSQAIPLEPQGSTMNSEINMRAGNGTEMLKIGPAGFWVRGVEVPHDANEGRAVYEAFVTWMKEAKASAGGGGETEQYGGDGTHAKQQAQELAENDEIRRCQICGFAVDLKYGSEKPAMERTTEGRTKRGLKDDVEDTNRAGGKHNPEGEKLREASRATEGATPRTDATWDAAPRADYGGMSVMRDLARTLERELAVAKIRA